MLVGQTYWWKDSRIDDLCWFVLQDHLRSLYAPHLLYVSEANYNVEHEPELECRLFTDICTEFLDEIRKLVGSQTVKVDADPGPGVVDVLDPKSPVLIEPDIVDEADSEVDKA